MNKLFGIALLVGVMPLLAVAEEAVSSSDGNVLYTLRVADVSAQGEAVERAAKLLSLTGVPAKLSTGWKLPIPTTRYSTATDPGGAGPVTAFSYQDVGVTATLESVNAGEGRLRVRGRIEVSAVEPGGPAVAGVVSAPRVARFEHAFEVLLEDGEETTLADVPRPEGGSMVLTLAAERQR